MKRWLTILMAGLVCSAGAVEVILTAVADTYLANTAGIEDRNYGARTDMTLRNERDGGGSQSRGLLRFDLSGLGTNIEINSVTLRMQKTAIYSGSNVNLDVYEVSAANSDWVEGNSTTGVVSGAASWPQKSTGTEDWAGSTGLSTAGTDYSTTVLAIDSDFTTGTKDFTSTADFATAVSNHLGGELNLFLSMDDAVAGSKSFVYASRDNTDGYIAPTLIIDYIPEPTHRWRFNGTPKDDGITREMGTLTNVSYVQGAVGTECASFNGTDSIGMFSNVYNSAEAYSVSLWIRPTARPTVRSTLLSKRDFDEFSLDLVTDSTNLFVQVEVRGLQPGEFTRLTAVNPIPLNEWSHVAFTVKGEQSARLYINAVEERSAALNYNPRGGHANRLFAGNHSTGSADSFFKGEIDDLRMYSNEVLTVPDLRYLMDRNEVRDPGATPIVYADITGGERRQHGYDPRYHPNPISFDAQNRPYIRYDTYVQTLNEYGDWERLCFTNEIHNANTNWNGVFGKGPFYEGRIVFDSAGDAWTHVTSAYVSGSNLTRGWILHSTDNCETWDIQNCWADRFVKIEQRDGNNYPPDRTRPPALLAYSGGHLYLVLLEKGADGLQASPTRILAASDVPTGSAGLHSGAGNTAVTVGTKIHFTYARTNAVPGGTGTPIYAKTYDTETGTFTEETLLGFGGRNVNIHNKGSITLDSHGVLHVLIGGHHDPALIYVKSLYPNRTDAWSDPLEVLVRSENHGHTYVSLLCDTNNTLHGLTRWTGDGYRFKLIYFNKPEASSWQEVELAPLFEPSSWNYTVWRHKLDLDRNGNLFVSKQYEPHQLFIDQWNLWSAAYPEDGLQYEAPVPTETTYAWGRAIRAKEPALLISTNNGSSFNLLKTENLLFEQKKTGGGFLMILLGSPPTPL